MRSVSRRISRDILDVHVKHFAHRKVITQKRRRYLFFSWRLHFVKHLNEEVSGNTLSRHSAWKDLILRRLENFVTHDKNQSMKDTIIAPSRCFSTSSPWTIDSWTTNENTKTENSQRRTVWILHHPRVHGEYSPEEKTMTWSKFNQITDSLIISSCWSSCYLQPVRILSDIDDDVLDESRIYTIRFRL